MAEESRQHAGDTGRAEATDLLLDVRNLGVTFRTDEGRLRVVDDVSFSIRPGETLGIVGESGSGKSVSTKALMHLLPETAEIDSRAVMRLRRRDGSVLDIGTLRHNSRTVRELRGGDISMIFQEPMSSLSPVYTIGNQLVEAIRQHRPMGKKEATVLAVDYLDRVGMSNPAQRVKQYPFELSGGMRQRAMIAIALATNPLLLIADEPTTALDVTIQAQILDLMRTLQDELDMSIIFISHDIGVISRIADRIAVMYLGRIMEQGVTNDVINNPQHPYTQSLLDARPSFHNLGERLRSIPGDIPGPMARPNGCVFHPRCSQIVAGLCATRQPALTTVQTGHTVECLLYEQRTDPAGDTAFPARQGD